MELATINLKLSGQSANTVIKHNVTPPQLAIYAFMHGEDCVNSLTITGSDDGRSVPAEMNRLRAEFTSEHAIKCLNTLFPGRFPHLPTSFVAIGFDPVMLRDDNAAPVVVSPQAKNQSEASIMQKIREASQAMKEEDGIAKLAPVPLHEMTDALDNTGDPEDDEDPIDRELKAQNEGGMATLPPPKRK